MENQQNTKKPIQFARDIFWKAFQETSACLEYNNDFSPLFCKRQAIGELSEEQKILYKAGYADALLEIQEKFCRNIWEEQQIINVLEKVPHITEILCLLRDHKTLSATDLAKQLNITEFCLQSIIHAIEACPIKLVNTEENKQYILYSLTPRGKYYAKKEKTNE